MPSPCTAASHAISVKAFRWCTWEKKIARTVTRNALAARNAVYSRSLTHRHPFSDFFFGEGVAVHRLSETDNPSSNCPSEFMDKVRWIVHSKLKSFHFQIKTYYLSDANYQTDNPSHTNNPSLVWKRDSISVVNECRALGLEMGVRSSAFAFSERLFLNWLLTFLCVKWY